VLPAPDRPVQEAPVTVTVVAVAAMALETCGGTGDSNLDTRATLPPLRLKRHG
jgi:hypothetical protein